LKFLYGLHAAKTSHVWYPSLSLSDHNAQLIP